MPFSINTNVSSLQAQNYLQKSSEFQSQTINEVTSGLRIVNSGDDAAGLAIANGYRSDEAVLNQGIQNANNGLATLQTVDGGMNNISTLLDRARTLATESASGTFSGARTTLNSEFQSVIAEVTRQATSIGMNQGGQFAQALNVFIGGGKGATSTAASANGTINVDLSKSAVDAQSLGLQGVQAESNTSVDLSAASATSVQNLINDATNKGSEATSGFTAFSFKGPGFSDGNAIGISVNLSGVADTQTLTTAINAAIQSAGNGTTAAATAFKNANISASVVTDSNGGQHIAFSSSSAAFQVQAGDQTANALLGNIASGTTGASLQTTYSAGTASAPSAFNTANTASAGETIQLQFQGAGMTSPTTITSTVTTGESVSAIMTNINTQIANNSALKAAGISVATDSTGSALKFQSTSGQQFSVNVGGDMENLLGMGSQQLGASNAVTYNTITAGTGYSSVTAAQQAGVANFQISLNGGNTQAVSVDLTAGDATAGSVTGTAALTDATVAGFTNTANHGLALKIDGGSTINVDLHALTTVSGMLSAINTALGSAGTATLNSSAHLVITSASTGVNSSVQILAAGTGDADATDMTAIGVTAGTTSGTARSLTSVISALNASFASNSTLAAAGLQAASSSGALQISSSNGTNFQVNTYGSTGTLTSSIANTYSLTSTTNNLAFQVDGGSTQTITLNASNTTASSIAADINTKLASAGITGFTASVDGGGHVQLNSSAGSNLAGTAHSIKVVTAGSNDSLAALGFSNNQTATAKNANVGFGNTGVAFNGNTQGAAPTTSPNVISAGAYSTSGLTFTALKNGSDNQTINVSATDSTGASHTANIVLQNNTTSQTGATIDSALNAINTALQQSNVQALQNVTAIKYNNGGTEGIKFVSANTQFSVTVGNTADASGISNQGTTLTAAVSGTGSTADISTITGAQSAVNALATAVQKLGTAQAAVGKGENNLNYAVSLAQSQVTNEAASESQLRDANLAQEAANLTKAQILVQAGTAALAQANSAPQQLLSLLQGH